MRDKYNKTMTKRAIKAFENHELITSNGDRWLIAKTYNGGVIQGQYATEIISLHNCRLFVGGDIEDVIFGYHSGKHLSKVSWVGNHKCVDSYIVEKASIGMRDGGTLTLEYDEDAAKDDLKRILQDFEEELSSSDLQPEIHETYLSDKYILTKALENTHNKTRMKQYLYDDLEVTDITEELQNIGKVYASRLFYAWAACRKLCELLNI